MILENSVTQSMSTAISLAEKGYTVYCNSNTVLESLVRVTNDSLAITDAVQVVGNRPFIESIELDDFCSFIANAVSGSDGPSKHDLEMDGCLDVLIKSVLNHINFCKNIVNPLVIDYTNSVIKYLDTYKFPDAASQFNIRVTDLPKPLYDTSFVEELSIYKDRSEIEPKEFPKLPSKNVDEIIELMMTRDSILDQAIVEWLSNIPNKDELLLTVWNSFFLSPNETSVINTNYISYPKLKYLNVFVKADYYLVVYLLANKLVSVVDSNLTNISLTEYQNIINDTKRYAGICLVNAIKYVSNYDVLKTVITDTNIKAKEVTVYGVNYNAFIEKGGKAETILGALVSDSGRMSISSLDTDIVKLTDEWNRYVTLTNTSNRNKTLDCFKDGLEKCFFDLMNSLSETEKEFINSNADYNDIVRADFKEQLENILQRDMENIYITCMKLLCRARFYYTDSEMILMDMYEVINSGTNVNAREAALIATINYVCNYVTDQMSIVKDTI